MHRSLYYNFFQVGIYKQPPRIISTRDMGQKPLISNSFGIKVGGEEAVEFLELGFDDFSEIISWRHTKGRLKTLE